MEAFGGHGEYVIRPEEIRPALERSFQLWQGITYQRRHGPRCAAPTVGVRLVGSAGKMKY